MRKHLRVPLLAIPYLSRSEPTRIAVRPVCLPLLPRTLPNQRSSLRPPEQPFRVSREVRSSSTKRTLASSSSLPVSGLSFASIPFGLFAQSSVNEIEKIPIVCLECFSLFRPNFQKLVEKCYPRALNADLGKIPDSTCPVSNALGFSDLLRLRL